MGEDEFRAMDDSEETGGDEVMPKDPDLVGEDAEEDDDFEDSDEL